jgi:AAA domain, putative AbiEii toxin, Type IV TA system
MIDSFELHNFRAFESSAPLWLAPHTCLAGRNSSGKSSFVNALLLLKQSAEEVAFGSALPRLRLNGPSYEGGTYEDVVFDHDSTKQLGFSFTCSFGSVERKWRSPLVSLEMPTPGIFFRRGARWWRDDPSLTEGRSAKVSAWFVPEESLGPTLSRLIVEVPTLGSVTFTRTSGVATRHHWRVYLSELPAKCVTPHFYPGELLPLVRPRARVYNQVGPHPKRRIKALAASANRAFSEIGEFLNSLRFLGPFRTPPSRRYVFSGFGGFNIGPSGEEAIDILIMERLLRPSDEQYLRLAVSFWLRHLGLASSIKVQDLAKRSNLFEIVLGNAGYASRANFADVGFGISQVLPVLVQGLLTPSGGTYVVQQPELHLHPDAQAELADFFLYLASFGVRSIVETHSEYFLVRLRRRLAEKYQPPAVELPAERHLGRTPISPESINVVALQESGSDGSKALQLKLDSAFQFANMPKGFMSQSLSERALLIKAISRAERR